MGLLTVICGLPGRILTVVRRRLRISRISWVQIAVILFILAIVAWRKHVANENYKLTMGQQGAVFKDIVDDVKFLVSVNGKLVVRNHDHTVLSINFNTGPFAGAVPCETKKENEQCFQYGQKAKTTVRSYSDDNAQCFDIHSISLGQAPYVTNCIDMQYENSRSTHWYGGAETYRDMWPVNLIIKERAHVSDHGGYGSVLERYWFSNRGVGIFVEDLVPLFVYGDKQSLCLSGKYDGDIFRNLNNEAPYLKYTVCVKGNVLDVHKYMSQRFIKKPIGIPDEKMIKYPVWSTWAKFKSSITQELTLQYTDEIANRGFPACQIEVDDRYTVNYGDYVFDPAKFPSPKEMLDYIHSKGFRVNVWTHPFSNYGSKSYEEGKELGYWVMDESGSKAGEARWWRGNGGALDVTNPDAVKWFHQRVQKIRDLGVDGHKFDAGEIGFLPPRFKTKKTLQNPCHYSSIYAESMYNITNNFMQMRVGYKTQHLPIFLSMMDRNSDWGYNMGLRSLITTSLVFGSMGYFFIMPDMIGGNAYCAGNMDCNDIKPERELFIRWVELNAFLPMMQFSLTPWQYDDTVVEIARKYVTLHADYVAPRIIALAHEATKTGYPIIRPMWWSAPDDAITHSMDSQFMVGNDLVVAPILEKGATTRNVYLPKGIWKDMITGAEYNVQKNEYLLQSYPVKLDEIAYFERVLIP